MALPPASRVETQILGTGRAGTGERHRPPRLIPRDVRRRPGSHDEIGVTESGEARPNGRTSIYWESTGTHDPVLLVSGLGLSGGTWWRTVATLSKRFRVITYDHRGVGRSQSPSYAYTTEAMAADAISVLDSAGIEHAHVYGMSLGGMVAQELTLRHPLRVRSLILGATQPGGPRAVPRRTQCCRFSAAAQACPTRRRPGRRYRTTTAHAAAGRWPTASPRTSPSGSHTPSTRAPTRLR